MTEKTINRPVDFDVRFRALFDQNTGMVLISAGGAIVPLGNTRTGEIYAVRRSLPVPGTDQVALDHAPPSAWKFEATMSPEQLTVRALLSHANMVGNFIDDLRAQTHMEQIIGAWAPIMHESRADRVDVLIKAADTAMSYRRGQASGIEVLQQLEAMIAMNSMMPEEVLSQPAAREVPAGLEKPKIELK